jgi:hypothetical protein
MSLHKFAEQVASQGRGDDSLLVHMTPDEVQRLQSFAEANGRSLTINPETGLPEAGMLSDLFKSIAPIALGAFLGPAGAAIGGGFMSAGMAGLTVGGITTLATGSLSRGLMAGLGAYGGAGIGDSLMKAGTGALSQTAGAGLVGEEAAQQAVASKLASATPMETLTAGFNSATANPTAMGAFAKNNLSNIGMAAAPILAMQPTTQMPSTAKSDNYIRQFDYNINPDTGKPDPLYGMRAMTPVKASEFGNKTFQGQRELFRQQNPNPYDIGIGSLNQPPQQQPTPMNTGGIVALANGGVPGYAGATGSVVGGSKYDQATINAALAAELADMAKTGRNTSQADLTAYAKSQYGLNDAQINAAYDTIPGFNAQGKYDAADYMATSKPGQVSPQMVVDAAAAANPYSAQNMAKVDITRPGQYVQDASGNYVALSANSPGFNANNPTALTYLGELASKGGQDSTSLAFNQVATPEQKAEADRLWAAEKARLTALDVAAGRLPADNKGLAGLNQNQNLLTNQDQNKNLNVNTGLAALPAGMSNAARWHAERGLGFTPVDKAIDNWFDEYTDDLALKDSATQVKIMQDALDVSGMNEADLIKATGKTIKDWIQIKTGDISKVNSSVLPGGVSGAGNTVVNANGTITTKPDFSLTMNDVRNAYTKGGGSLGYTSPVVKTPAEHEAAYNKLTDDSLDAYNFLMGKGKNLSQRTATADRPVMRRYDEGVLGRKIPKLTKAGTTTKKTGTEIGTFKAPQTYFDEKAYLAANPDVAEELRTGKSVTGRPVQFTSGYEHYLMFGKAGGRPFTGDYDSYKGAVDAEKARIVQQETAGGGEGGGPGGGGGGGTGGGGSGGNAAGAAAAGAGGNAAPGTGNAGDSAAAASAASAAAGVGVGDSAASGGRRGGRVVGYAIGGGLGSLGSYSDGGRLLKGPGDGVSDSIPATIGRNRQPARLADGEFVVPARIVSELGNGSTEAGAKKLYAMMDRVQRARGKTTGKNKVAANSRADKYLPA